MDFYGKGFITEEDFLNSVVMNRIPFSKDEVKEYFKQNNMFTKNSNANNGQKAGMTFDQFKKTFFP